MSATEELRRLLDEAGVEWDADDETMDDGSISQVTYWYSNGIDWSADGRDEYLAFDAVQLITPAQAIAATLGVADATGERQGDAGTCHVEGYDDGVDEGLDGEWYSYMPPTWYLSCDHTAQGRERPNFCPVCGKVVTA